MRYYISHDIRYSYDRPVFIEPHTVRLRPFSNSVQQVIQFALEIVPEPTGISEHIDHESNNTATVWFDGLHPALSFSMKSEVEVSAVDPYNYIVTHNDFLSLPASYPEGYRQDLQPYLERRYGSLELDEFIRPVIEENGKETIPFIAGLNSHIYGIFDRVMREEGAPMVPVKTIAEGKGACRDLALLFIEGCRAVGLAARFISGYRWSENNNNGKQHLHAWAEVYIPGAGWRGFDPSTGLAAGDRHVAVAAAAEPADAAPISGTFRGTGVKSRLEYDVTISISPELL
jgi:transglutaminase-like putative cysteine protease